MCVQNWQLHTCIKLWKCLVSLQHQIKTQISDSIWKYMETQIVKRCQNLTILFAISWQHLRILHYLYLAKECQRWHLLRSQPTDFSFFHCLENLEFSFWPESVVAGSLYFCFRHILYGKFTLFLFSFFIRFTAKRTTYSVPQ